MTKAKFDPDPNAADYYARLGVPVFADGETIEEAGKKAISTYHPDRNTKNDEETAEALYKQIKQAREVLSDDTDQEAYDTFLERFGTEAGTETFERWEDRGRPAPPEAWTPPSDSSTSAETETQASERQATSTTERETERTTTESSSTSSTPTIGSDTTAVVGPRAIAFLIDGVITFILGIMIASPGFVIASGDFSLVTLVFVVLGALSLPTYNILLEGFWNGQTIGKRLLNIRVTNERGENPTVKQAFIRNVPAIFGATFSWIAIAIGVISIMIDSTHQRVFDKFANTYVIRA